MEEELPQGAPYLAHMVAGALAGISEHCAMYPVDTVKTRMQVIVLALILRSKCVCTSRPPWAHGIHHHRPLVLRLPSLRTGRRVSDGPQHPRGGVAASVALVGTRCRAGSGLHGPALPPAHEWDWPAANM